MHIKLDFRARSSIHWAFINANICSFWWTQTKISLSIIIFWHWQNIGGKWKLNIKYCSFKMHANYLHENQNAYFAKFKSQGTSAKELQERSQHLFFACLFICVCVSLVHRSIRIQAFPADWTLTHNFPNSDYKFQSTLSKYYWYNTKPFV